jgi:hypothetical protein
MKPVSLGDHETRSIGAPAGWNPERDGECAALSVHDYVDERGHAGMISRWELEPGDLERLRQGAPVHLSVLGKVHPVVSIYLGEAEPERAAVDPALAEGAPCTDAAMCAALAIAALRSLGRCEPAEAATAMRAALDRHGYFTAYRDLTAEQEAACDQYHHGIDALNAGERRE